MNHKLYRLQNLHARNCEVFKIACKLHFKDIESEKVAMNESRQAIIDYFAKFYKHVLIIDIASTQ